MLIMKKAEVIFNECFSMVGCYEKAKILASYFIIKKIETTNQEYLKDFWTLVSNHLNTKFSL